VQPDLSDLTVEQKIRKRVNFNWSLIEKELCLSSEHEPEILKLIGHKIDKERYAKKFPA
jgi:hypothetical protein